MTCQIAVLLPLVHNGKQTTKQHMMMDDDDDDDDECNGRMLVGETRVPCKNLPPNTMFFHHKFQLDMSGFELKLPV